MYWTAIGGTRPQFRLFYDLHIPGERPTIGAFYFMQPSNRALVQRTFGLLELQALEGMLTFCLRCYISADPSTNEDNQSHSSTSLAQKERYGPTFAYDEFLVMRSKTSGFFFTLSFVIGLAMMAYVAPVSFFCVPCSPCFS